MTSSVGSLEISSSVDGRKEVFQEAWVAVPDLRGPGDGGGEVPVGAAVEEALGDGRLEAEEPPATGQYYTHQLVNSCPVA